MREELQFLVFEQIFLVEIAYYTFEACDLDLKSCTGLGMVPHNILDQFLSHCQTGIKSIKGSTETDIVNIKHKTLTQKNSKSVTLTLRSRLVLHKIYHQTIYEPNTSLGLEIMRS